MLFTFIREHPRAAFLYGGFITGCLIIYKTLEAKSTGQYDYMLTLSAAFQTLGFGLLVFDTKSNAAEGLSEKSLWTFFIANVTRLSTTFWGEGYVPEDNTSNVFLYQAIELCGVFFVAYQLLKLSTVRAIHDVGQGMEKWSTVLVMIAVALVLAYNTHSTGHADYFADMSWMFSVWLEAFALIPQVYLLKQQSKVDETAAHFAGFTLVSSVIFASFWLRHTRESQSLGDSDLRTFDWAIGTASLIRVVLCGAYCYLFMQSSNAKAKGGGPGYEMVGQDEL